MKKFTKGMLITAGVFGVLGIGLSASGVAMGATVDSVEILRDLRDRVNAELTDTDYYDNDLDDRYDDDRYDDDYDDEGISDDTRSVDEFDDDDFDSFDDYNIKKEKRKKGDTFEMDFIDLD